MANSTSIIVSYSGVEKRVTLAIQPSLELSDDLVQQAERHLHTAIRELFKVPQDDHFYLHEAESSRIMSRESFREPGYALCFPSHWYLVKPSVIKTKEGPSNSDSNSVERLYNGLQNGSNDDLMTSLGVTTPPSDDTSSEGPSYEDEALLPLSDLTALPDEHYQTTTLTSDPYRDYGLSLRHFTIQSESNQIYHEAKKFAKAYNLSVTCVYGGSSKWEQSNAVKEGCEILVATPGRLIDLVKLKVTNLQRVTYLVFDEADRMFDMGFEAQVRSIANHVRPDRQTLLFSATFRKRIERLCRDVLTDPVRIVVGDLGESNTDIIQIVEVMKDEHEKWRWLLKHIVEFTSTGSVLVFVTRKTNSEEVASGLKSEGRNAGLLHGDMSQGDRDQTILSFKKKEFPILVATDVAARGLDIPSIKTVINFDVAKDIDTHVHRIGRTGRAGEKGTAFTLITHKDSQFAGDLVRNLEVADQRVPDDLIKIAMQNSRFKRTRQKHGGKGRGHGGQRLRPGLGATSETISTMSSAAVPPPPSLGPMGSIVGPGGNRSSVLKQNYMASYKMKFQQASGSLASTSSLGQQAPPTKDHTHSEDPPPPKRKRKSRWD